MTLQIYVLRQLLVSVGFSLAGIGLLVIPTIAVQSIHKLRGVKMSAVLEYLPLVVIELVPYLLPMGFLLGIVATYGRLAVDRELVAIRMAGIHPARLALPGLVLALGLSVLTNHLLSTVSPQWKYVQRNYLRDKKLDAFKNVLRGRTQIEFGRSSIFAQRARGNALEEVLLDLKRDDEELTVVADVARIDIVGDELILRLEGAQVLGADAQLFNENPVLRWDLLKLFPKHVRPRGDVPKYMADSEIEADLERQDISDERRTELEFELHRRDALSVTYFLFLLLGIPTGIVLRSGTQLGAFTGAMGYAFLYYVLALRLGKELAESTAVPAAIAAWSTNALFLVVGLVLFYRTLWR